MKLPLVGETFLDRYELQEVLGKGGFATIFGAWDTRNQRKVVIKVLSPGRDGYPNSTGIRFKREAATFATFKSPHIVTMYDHGTAPDGLLYIVFEHVDGRDLKRVIAEQGPLDEKVTLHILRQLLDALTEAHDQGILHRDIKPDNVLVYQYMDDPWRVKLLDFGLAKDSGDDDNRLTQTGIIVGTMRYMPPEQIRAGRLGPESDLYSLGLVVYEMRMRREFIEGATTDEMLKAHAAARSVPLAELFQDRNIGEAVQRLGVRDRSRRAQSARSVIAGMQGRPTDAAAAAIAAAPKRRDLPPPPPASKGWYYGGAAAAIVAVLIGAMLIAYRSRATEPTVIQIAPPRDRANPLQPVARAPVATATTKVPDGLVPDEATPEVVPEQPTTKADPCTATATPGWRQDMMPMGLGEMPIAYYLPQSYKGTEPTSLLLVTSPYGPKSGAMIAASGLVEVSEKQGFLVMLLGTSDLALIDRALETTNETLCLDTNRVFSANFAPFGAIDMGSGVTGVVGCHPWIAASADIATPYMPMSPADDAKGCGRPLLSLGQTKDIRGQDCAKVRKLAGRDNCQVIDCTRPSIQCELTLPKDARPFDLSTVRVTKTDWTSIWGFFLSTSGKKSVGRRSDQK